MFEICPTPSLFRGVTLPLPLIMFSSYELNATSCKSLEIQASCIAKQRNPLNDFKVFKGSKVL